MNFHISNQTMKGRKDNWLVARSIDVNLPY